MNNKLQTLEKDENCFTIMNEKNLKIICERDGLYMCPHLNDKLYLHYKGFDKIQNLEPYSNLCALWLNNNGIIKIEGLSTLVNLSSLFLNHNLISKIENIENCVNLRTLNLSHNRVKKIEGLSQLILLQNFNISFNHLSSVESLEGLTECQSITSLDLSTNIIEYDENVLQVMQQMSNLLCLYLKGNQLVRVFPNYRKRFITAIPKLVYLDDRPVNENERRISQAWVKEGPQGEINERNEIARERREEQLKTFNSAEARVQENQRLKDEKLLEEKEKLIIKKQQLQQEFDEANEEDQSELTEQISQTDAELQNLEQNIIKKMEYYRPYACLSVTHKENGEVIILNKTQEEQDYILKNLYTAEQIEFSRSEQEKINEELQRRREQAIRDQIDKEEEEQLEGIADLTKQYKDFLIRDVYKLKDEQTPPLQKEQPETIQNELNDDVTKWQNLMKNWTSDLTELLQALLTNLSFDFQQASQEFKVILNDLNLVNIPSEAEELKIIWTYIELTKFRGKNIVLFKDQNNLKQEFGEQKNDEKSVKKKEQINFDELD